MNEPFESSLKTAINENQGHKRPPQKWGPIVVGTDGSVGAARAVEVASILAADLNADLWIANVMDGTSDSNLAPIARAENISKGDVAEAIGAYWLMLHDEQTQTERERFTRFCWPEIPPMRSLRQLEMSAHQRSLLAGVAPGGAFRKPWLEACLKSSPGFRPSC